MKHTGKIFTLLILCFVLPLGGCKPEAQHAAPSYLDIEEFKTRKGITVWHVEDHQLPIISLRFTFRHAGAKQNSAAQQGLSRLLSNMLDEGAGDLDSTAFQKALSDHSIGLGFSASRDHFEGHLMTLSRHQDTAFMLARLALTAPRFNAEPLARMIDANLSRIRHSMSEPDWIHSRLINDILYQGHPYALNSGGTLSTLPTLTAEDLRRFKDGYLTRDRLIISATGDIDKESLSKIIDDIFGSLPARGPKSMVADTTLQNQGKIFLYDKDIPQTLIEMVLNGPRHDHPDYYAFLVMNSLFGGTSFGSRLMEEAREKEGLTYGIYSSLSETKHVNSFHISTSTKNESVPRMMEIIREQMNAMASAPVDPDKISAIKTYITGSLPLSLTKTEQISAMLQSMQIKGYPMTYLDDFKNNIDAVTAEQVQQAAKDYLTPATVTTILVGRPQNIDTLEPAPLMIESLPNVE